MADHQSGKDYIADLNRGAMTRAHLAWVETPGTRAVRTEAAIRAYLGGAAACTCPDQERNRDLTRRIGFGDGITEPMADNDAIVAWFEEQVREADEWREHERFRDECALAGHDPLNDCDEHGPTCCYRAHAFTSPQPCCTEAAGWRNIALVQSRVIEDLNARLRGLVGVVTPPGGGGS